jgi:hypothetical protein
LKAFRFGIYCWEGDCGIWSVIFAAKRVLAALGSANQATTALAVQQKSPGVMTRRGKFDLMWRKPATPSYGIYLQRFRLQAVMDTRRYRVGTVTKTAEFAFGGWLLRVELVRLSGKGV